jgi:mono/diheme cytochrome c family protein
MMRQTNLFTIAVLSVGFELVGPFALVGAEHEQGGALYVKECQVCHGVKGDGEFAADFTSPRFWEENSEGEMAEAIKDGRGPMPAFDLKPDEIQALIGHISHAFRKDKEQELDSK